MISGYRELSERELSFINAIKLLHNEVGELWLQLVDELPDVNESCMQQALYRLNEGFMWFVRGVAKPDDPFVRKSSAAPDQ